MKIIYKLTVLVGIAVLAVSCKNDLKPNYQYMPNMYENVGYGTYAASDAFKGGVEAQLPAVGSIKRGFEVYGYENSTDGYNLSLIHI
jgi:hypothetical protein